MLTKKTRILIIFIALVIGIISSINKIYWLAALVGVLALYMIFAYFKHASVSLAFKKIKQKNYCIERKFMI